MPNRDAPEYYVVVTRVKFKNGKVVVNVYGLWDKPTAQEEAKLLKQSIKQSIKKHPDYSVLTENVYVRKLHLNLETDIPEQGV